MTVDLSEDLKRVIDEYLDGHRSRSLATLSRVSGVSYTTLRRFWQKEGHPTAEPVLKIVDATLGGAAKIDFVNRHFPEIARTIDHFSRQTSGQTGSHSNGAPAAPGDDGAREELKLFYQRDPHNFILNLAVTTRGTTLDDVRYLCGERGIEALDEMVECGVLERDFATGRVWYREDSMLSLDCDVILNCVRAAVDYFDRRLIGTKAAKLCHATASVSEDGLHRIHEIVSDALHQIVAVKEDRRYTGDVPFFLDLMMNVLDKRPLAKYVAAATSEREPDHA